MSRLTNRSRIDLEQLADRIVPATLIDLTTEGAENGAAGAIVRQVDAQPTGTGFIHSFVRVQSAANGSSDAEQGYNTTARPLQFDENRSPQFTRSLQLDDVPTVTVGDSVYREFLLDINQKGSAPKLSLDEVRLYLGAAPDLTGYDSATKTLEGLEAVFDLDENGDVSVLLNYRLNSGSGSGDMTLLVPQSAFDGATASTYIYLYSKFGTIDGYRANSGFEEWAVRGSGGYGGGNSGGGGGGNSGGAVGTNSLSGRVFVDSFVSDGIQELDRGELGLAGVTIHLEGTNTLNETVHLIAVTDANGDYSFVNLLNGTYTLWEEQPMDYNDGVDTLGTVNGTELGTAGNDLFTELLLSGGIHGLFYNFAETLRDDGG